MYEDTILDGIKSKKVSDRPYQGKINKAIKNQSETLDIVIDEIDEKASKGPCYWTPRSSVGGPVLPEGGETCLAVLDNEHRWWVLAWWPYA